MKKVLFVLVVLLIVSLPALSQGWVGGVGGNGAMPMGDFKDFAGTGFGGSAWAGYVVDQNLTITAKVEYLKFGSKDVTTDIPAVVVGSVTIVPARTITTTYPGGNIIPILVGARYFFMPPSDMRVYGAAEAGIFNISDGGGSKVGFAPTLGAQFKAGEKMNVDVNVNYTYVSTENKATTWLGFGLGLEFVLQ